MAIERKDVVVVWSGRGSLTSGEGWVYRGNYLLDRAESSRKFDGLLPSKAEASGRRYVTSTKETRCPCGRQVPNTRVSRCNRCAAAGRKGRRRKTHQQAKRKAAA